MPAKIFCFEGDDSFKIKKEVDKVKAKFLDPATEIMNYDLIEDSDIEKAINSVSMIPFFGTPRLVHLKNPSYLRAVKTKLKLADILEIDPEIKNDVLEYFTVDNEEYLKLIEAKYELLLRSHPDVAMLLQGNQARVENLLKTILNADENVILLISSTETMLDKRKKAVKELKKISTIWGTYVKPTSSSKNFDLNSWLQSTAAESGHTFAPDALQMLNSIGGRDLNSFSNEVAKFVTYAGERKTITLADVRQLISYDELADFEIANAVRSRDKKRLLSVLHKVLKDDYGLLMQTIGGISYQVRAFLKVKTLFNKGQRNQYEIGKLVGMHNFTVSLILRDINKYTSQELRKIIIALHEMDYAIKSGTADSGLLLELTISKYF